MIVIFVWGFTAFLNLNVPPANAYEVLVTGQKWKWLFTYPNGHVDEDLHVPVNTPVSLVMTSEDVIHGFYVPAFRLKRDVVPGRYVKLWFRAVKPGEYQIYCARVLRHRALRHVGQGRRARARRVREMARGGERLPQEACRPPRPGSACTAAAGAPSATR